MLIEDELIVHDILWFYWGDEIVIVDPTLWQFFPESKNIFVFSAPDTLDWYISSLSSRYWQDWKVSEVLDISMIWEKETWAKMIIDNIEAQFLSV